MSRIALGEFEHHVMLALQRLGGRAHGPPVVTELEQATGKSVSPASVFIALRRLEQRGLTKSKKHVTNRARPDDARTRRNRVPRSNGPDS